ncbi:MAG TPA: IS3 family transposase [Anaerovoracaceae bacterium]|nr:IS3 family transposase [Anaerovoracaceae bacterium]
MYSLEQRTKAVELYIKYCFHEAKVIKELGYPTFKMLPIWYNEYFVNGSFHESKKRYSKFTVDQRLIAIAHYFEHGQCVARTVKALGYPSRPLLKQWVEAGNNVMKSNCKAKQSLIEYSQIEQTSGLRKQMHAKGYEKNMTKTKRSRSNTVDNLYEQNSELLSEKAKLSHQVEVLQQEVRRLQLEKDILEKAAEIIKKDKGISLKTLTNREKAIVIDALRDKYLLKELLKILDMAKSSYCYQKNVLKAPDKYSGIRYTIETVFNKSSCRYGYRRIHAVIKNDGIVVSEKVIRRIMKEEHLMVPYIKRKKYSSYKGEISPAVENVIQRDFHAKKPNIKWLTDITEFRIPAGKIYLSPIIDCFDGMPVSWSIGTSPDAELVNTMLDSAISLLREEEHPIIHSDRGCHYRWPGWIERMNKANFTRSMSKKGCSPDNSACEGFFGRLKNEMFYGYSWTDISIEQFIQQVDSYIKWYAEKRIKISLGAMSPLDYRKSLGLVV